MTQEELDKLWRDPGSWRGFIYYCPEDPRLIVPMRTRWTGYSINHFRRGAILTLIAILTALVAPVLLLVALEPPGNVIWTVVAFLGSVVAITLACHWESTRAR